VCATLRKCVEKKTIDLAKDLLIMKGEGSVGIMGGGDVKEQIGSCEEKKKRRESQGRLDSLWKERPTDPLLNFNREGT